MATRLNPTTYKEVAKSNPKDLLEVFIGDDKQAEFCPQIKIQRWDNECNVSIRLKHDEKTPKHFKYGDKIKWQGKKQEAHFYTVDNGFEFEVLLKEKPDTNIIEFTLQDKDVVYYYQPELTQKEKDEGSFRPDNVVGSYAVYAKTPKTNWTDGKLYRTGKIGHIYRPKIIDAEGKWAWEELHIENGLLTITIPQEFLDNAVYPIISRGVNFGYETIGTTGQENVNINQFRGSVFPSNGAGTITTVSIYGSGNIAVKPLIVLHSSLAIITNGVGGATTLPSSADWAISTFSTSPSVLATTDYVLGYVSSANFTNTYYDTGDADQGHGENDNNYGTPTNLTSISHTTRKYSIYATYGNELSATYTALSLVLTIPSVTATWVLELSATYTALSFVATIPSMTATLTSVWTASITAVSFVATIPSMTATYACEKSATYTSLSLVATIPSMTAVSVIAGEYTATFTAVSLVFTIPVFRLLNNQVKSTAISPTNATKTSITPTNQAKTSITPTNAIKTAISPTNQVKHSSTFTNQAKT